MTNKLFEVFSDATASKQQITHDITLLKFTIVNLYIIGEPKGKDSKWMLVDTGLAHSAKIILEEVHKLYGEDCPPQAIILTHGHFDHVGSVIELADHWNIPVYAHKLELPFLTGQQDYPPADPTVGEGLIAEMSFLFPNDGIDLGHRIHALPEDGSLSFMPEWQWIHTPGHTPGHISLFRKSDGILIAGDAITTVKQESFLSVLTQKQELNGPPSYFTTDWSDAEKSVKRLQQLNPSLAITSHGTPMKGEELKVALANLTAHFQEEAVPEQGRYVDKS
jgi:glyoxylase-like metal-dependent hydrolase (beta-lactamase superfamily II)